MGKMSTLLWGPSFRTPHCMNRTQMQKLLFLNVGWTSKNQGLNEDTITGGGAYVSSHGFGHERFNFRPFRGRMYGFGEV